jgi:hypothetical protein
MDSFNEFVRRGLHVGAAEHPVIAFNVSAFDMKPADAFNYPVFPAPNPTVNNSLFGTISGAQANRPRQVQLGARLVF